MIRLLPRRTLIALIAAFGLALVAAFTATLVVRGPITAAGPGSNQAVLSGNHHNEGEECDPEEEECYDPGEECDPEEEECYDPGEECIPEEQEEGYGCDEDGNRVFTGGGEGEDYHTEEEHDAVCQNVPNFPGCISVWGEDVPENDPKTSEQHDAECQQNPKKQGCIWVWDGGDDD